MTFVILFLVQVIVFNIIKRLFAIADVFSYFRKRPPTFGGDNPIFGGIAPIFEGTAPIFGRIALNSGGRD